MLGQDGWALRHFLRSLVFRFSHVTEGTPESFGSFQAGAEVRTPARTVLHMTGLLDWAANTLLDEPRQTLEPLSWDEERKRFVKSAQRLDRALAAGAEPLGEITLAQLWQGPITDAMTHVGQLATLRRLYGSPVAKGVRYWQVEMPEL